MKARKLFVSFFVVFALLLTGCSLGDRESQITKLDSKYVQNNDTDTSATKSPQESTPDSTQKPDEPTSENSKDNQDEESSDKNKKETEEDSTSVEKEENTSSSKKKDSQQENVKNRNSKKSNHSSKKKSDSKKSSSTNTNSKNTNTDKNNASNTPSDSNSNSANPSSASPADTDDESSKDTCTISIDCKTILSNMKKLNSAKKSFVPSDGKILKSTKVAIESGDSVYDILNRTCKKYKIHMEAAYTPAYKTYYVEGINQLYEFDCGDLSGWTFKVNGKSPNYGCSKYFVKAGDVITWSYTCDAGRDVGDDFFD